MEIGAPQGTPLKRVVSEIAACSSGGAATGQVSSVSMKVRYGEARVACNELDCDAALGPSLQCSGIGPVMLKQNCYHDLPHLNQTLKRIQNLKLSHF